MPPPLAFNMEKTHPCFAVQWVIIFFANIQFPRDDTQTASLLHFLPLSQNQTKQPTQSNQAPPNCSHSLPGPRPLAPHRSGSDGIHATLSRQGHQPHHRCPRSPTPRLHPSLTHVCSPQPHHSAPSLSHSTVLPPHTSPSSRQQRSELGIHSNVQSGAVQWDDASSQS